MSWRIACLAPVRASASIVARRNVSSAAVRSQIFVGNEWRDAADGKTFAVNNPYTGELIVNCAAATAPDVDIAVRSAHAAQWDGAWGQATTGASRAVQLHKMAEVLRSEKDIWAEIETADNGKPIVESRVDIDTCADTFDYFAELAKNLDTPDVRDTKDPDILGKVIREPAGVVACITPWNFPLLQSVAKVAPALAAGCAVVLKPSAAAPLTTLKIADLALAAGLPAGALNILPGQGGDVGTPLGLHPLIDRVSYTGSSAVGKSIMRDAAMGLRYSTMELGGKGSLIVFDDYADLDAAVDWAMVGIFICTGQVCSATSRLIVHESIKEKFLEKLVEKVKTIRIGDPMLESTQMGPMCTRSQSLGVRRYIEEAAAEGISVLVGGADVPAGLPDDGSFVRPTVLGDVPENSKAWKDEIFGPVLCVRSFKTEEEAVQLANASEYGLADGVLSGDQARCDRIARRLRSGVVWQNCNQAIPVAMPFGGFKQSGFGKEFGTEGLNEYLQSKSIIHSKPGFAWNWYA